MIFLSVNLLTGALSFFAIVLVVSAAVAGFCGLAVSGIILLFLVSGLGYPPLIRFRFSSSAHAMVFKGTFNVFLFPQGTQVTNLCLLNSSFWISPNWTFTITEPSFR